MKRNTAALQQKRPDEYIKVQIAGKIKISESTGVNSAAAAFELVDQLHGADLGTAGHRASGETSLDQIKGIAVAAQGSLNGRGRLKNRFVFFDRTHVLDFDGTEFAHAAE